jgi:hypothetical protein
VPIAEVGLTYSITSSARVSSRADTLLPHEFDANAQNHLSFSTTFAFVKPAPMSSSVNPLFGCPE